MKIEIGRFDGTNWPTWKYKVLLLLKTHTGAIEALNGSLQMPSHPGTQATADDLKTYKNKCDEFNKIQSTALLLLTTNMTEEMLTKVMRFTSVKEMWDELNRLYERSSQDRSYDICLEFFKYKKEPQHDMGSHLSVIKNLWHDLNKMLSADGKELPEILLICKVLDTLPEDYFSFKSSWMLVAMSQRTIENLTTQLCAYERALANRNINNDQVPGSADALIVQKSKQIYKKRNKIFKCNYCGEEGHGVKKCSKWIADGKPPKLMHKSTCNTTMLMSLAFALHETEDRDSWWVDNGATSHVTHRGDIFESFEYFAESHKVMTANGQNIEAIGKGSIRLEADINGKKKELITLSNVWYVPSIKRNLFSVLATQDLNEKSHFESRTKSCMLKVNGQIKLMGYRERYGGLYKLKVKVLTPNVQINALTMSNQLQLYHERFGHQNKRHVKEVIQREFGIKIKSKDDEQLCQGCVYGKAHRNKFRTRERATCPGQLISTDVCGPFPYSISNYRYYVLFKDDFSRFRHIYFLRQKSEVAARLKDFLRVCKTFGHVIKEILSDNGGEFDNDQVRSILREEGIKQRLIMPFTPEQNGSAERDNRTIVEMVRTLMHAHNEIPKGLWAEIANTSVYILNRTGPTTQQGKSPYELWYYKKPKISHLRIIGCECYVHIPKQRRVRKLDRKAQKGILIGYDGNDGYRVYDKVNFKLLRSRDVTFQEVPLVSSSPINLPIEIESNPKPISNTYEFELPTSSKMIQPYSHNDVNVDCVPEQPEEDFESIHSEDESDNERENINENNDIQQDERPVVEDNRRVLRDRSQIKAPERFNFENFINEVISDPEPSSYREAMKSTDKEMWVEAMNKEISSLKENQTWDLTKLPKNRKALRCKWVFRIKRNPDGTVDKYKARLVAVGYSQKKGIDYDKTFSPVAKMSSIRALLSIAANEGLTLRQFDVSTAFLYGTVKEEIYMYQPEGYNDGSGKVCKLKRSLYGLKQAPKCWNECMHDFLIKSEFKQSDADPCLYVRQREKTKILLALYVDDGLLASSNDLEAETFIERELRGRFKITTKTPSYFLGLELENGEEGSIKVHQTAYTKKILEKYGMNNCKVVGTPIIKEPESDNSQDEDVNFPYRQAVGALSYLMVGTRPDIAFAVGVVSRNLENPSKQHVAQVKRIFRYLKGTLGTGLVYKRGVKQLVCYSDADLGGDLRSGCSTTGILCLYAGAAISWRSVKQASVALSSTEAEIVAASEACREIIWLKRLIENLSNQVETPVLFVDSESAIKLSQNPPYEFHRKTKHIRLKHFYIRECVTEGSVKIQHVTTQEQLADLMTKPVFKPKLMKFSEMFGLKKERAC